MTRRPCVLIKETGVTHARALGERTITRCGVEYDPRRAPLFDPRPAGDETNGAIDCMTCLIKDEATNADPRVIRTAHGIKDLRKLRVP